MGIEPVSDVIKRNRLLRWLGHLLGKDDCDWVKKCISFEMDGAKGTRKAMDDV